MKFLTEHLWFEVKGRRGFINITDTVADLVLRSGVNEGLCLCNAMHITGNWTSMRASGSSIREQDSLCKSERLLRYGCNSLSVLVGPIL